MAINFVPPSKEELAARGIGAEKQAPKVVKTTEKKPATPKTKE